MASTATSAPGRASTPAADPSRERLDEAEPRHRVPGATYRLQFHAGFTFRDAAGIVPYLNALGITHCYCSSYLQAVPGSLHGYDVADPTSLNREVGSDEDFRAFVDVLHAHGMGQVLDVVPNHMGIAKSTNRWWQDVLENGPSSRYARTFDIDWHPLKPELANKVLLPILGDQYGAVLERGEIQLVFQEGAFCLRYFETTLPLAPRSYATILRYDVARLTASLGNEHEDVQELLSIITSLEHLPERTETDPERLAERQREKEIAKRRLSQLIERSAPVAEFIAQNVRTFNGTPGQPASFDLLDGLLNDQAYRLAHWRVASEEINYRRFFDINELAAVRMEDPAVFDETHELVFRLLAEGAIDGLRIDHVDGLYDPGDYLRRLEQRARDLGLGSGERPIYLIVEKILAPDEAMPADWPVHGTTGYDFANAVNGMLIDRTAARAFDEIYTRFTGERQSFADVAYAKKKLIMQVGMASEVNVLGYHLNLLSERNRRYRDFTLISLVHAIREIIASFPVYRTYISAGPTPVSERDRRYIDRAVELAKRRNPAITGLVFDFIRDLLLKRADYIPESEQEQYLRFVTKFQQTTSPVTAKGVEDTAFYLYNRLVSLNEVGGEPSRFGVGVTEFHAWLGARQREWPLALSATSTHDTKRSEDVRARISVLSEIPGAWKQALQRWSRVNRRHLTDVNGNAAPDRNEEYLLYQTLLGAWPSDAIDTAPPADFVARIQAYMVKALREGKRHTSWLNPNTRYEDAVTAFVAHILDPGTGGAFLDEARPLLARTLHSGMWNSLSQTLVKIGAPGVPDFYQGTELWDYSLVDPDNRRPVDYDARRRLIETLGDAIRGGAALPKPAIEALVRERLDGRLKLYTIARALELRRAHRLLFEQGEYVPLEVIGSRAAHLFAFGRQHGDRVAISIVPRLTATLLPDPSAAPIGPDLWGDTRVLVTELVADGRLRQIFTDESVHVDESGSVRVADALGTFPVALLTSN